VTPGEMNAFVAMIFAMGLVNQENIQAYWSTDEVLSTPFFPQTMSRDKFMNILSFFTCVITTIMFPEDRQATTQSTNSVLLTVLSLKSFQAFGRQAKIFVLMKA